MPRKMTAGEREAFLADRHVGIISINSGEGRAPFAVPVWYSYEPGGVVTVLTAPDTLKARLVKATGNYTLTAQDEEPPYKYVAVSGPLVETSDPTDPDERLAMAQRYLGEEGGRGYMAEMGSHPNAAFRMRPTVWRSFDYGA